MTNGIKILKLSLSLSLLPRETEFLFFRPWILNTWKLTPNYIKNGSLILNTGKHFYAVWEKFCVFYYRSLSSASKLIMRKKLHKKIFFYFSSFQVSSVWKVKACLRELEKQIWKYRSSSCMAHASSITRSWTHKHTQLSIISLST